MDRERLEKELRNHFSAEARDVEPSHNWWHNAIARINLGERRSRWSGLMPKKRLAWVLAPALVLLVSGTVYAASPILRDLFQRHAPQIVGAGLARELDLSQTINGITVSLERAYADSNVALAGFTVSGPEARYQPEVGGLFTADGQNIPAMIGVGTRSKATMGDLDSSATIVTFDTSSLKDVPSELRLILEVNVAGLPVIPILGESKIMAGPFKFEFEVPFHAGKSIDIGRTVAAAGVPVTLEQVVISPWGARAVLQLPGGDKYMPAMVSFNLPDGDSVNGAISKQMESSIVQYFMGDFTGQAGEWTMTVSELVLESADALQQRLAGPWVFRFDVP
jgi:hypothetical protein